MKEDRPETSDSTQREETRDAIRMLLELDRGTPGVLARGLRDLHPADIAEVLQDFDAEAAALVVAALPMEAAAEVIDETDPLTRSSIIEAVPDARITELVEAMPPDEGADLLELLSEDERKGVLAAIEPEQAREIRKLEEYDPETAGGIMTTHFVAVTDNATTDEALAAVRANEALEAFHYVYVTDARRRLTGVVTARNLVASPRGARVDSIMEDDVVSVRTDEDQETVASLVHKYNFSAIPVVNEARRLVGVITVDDVIDVLEEEFSEDIFRLAGTAATHPTLEPVLRRVLLRLPWLLVTLTGGIVVSLVMRRYQTSLEEMVAIFFFLPAVNAMGGNVGIQSSTIIVRGLATGEVDFSRLRKVLSGELRVGALLAVFFGVMVAVLVYSLTLFLSSLEGGASAAGPDPVRLGLAVGLAMMAGIVASALVGTLVPMGCSRIGIDPAITAGPFVTVLNDIFCTAIYFTVSTLILIGGA